MASLLSGTTIGGHVAVHANNISTYALTSLPSHTHDDRYIRFTGAELTEGNYYYFRSNRGSYLGGLDSATLQVYATGGNSAFMSFHRSGNYAVNFGLDADNVMRIGGWSAGADRWVLDMSGNNWVAGSFRAPIFYDSQDTAYYVDPNSTSSLNRIVTAGRLEVTYNTDRYQMNFYRASASNWWVTNDSDRLGLHLNNVGDKFYFATDGDFYSTANGWLSTALAGKLSTSGNAASATTASQVSGVAISSGQAQALKNTLDSPTLPYKCDIYVDGEANKFYPVHFMFGDQDIWRRIIIRRGYGEEAPWDPIGTGVHHGGLLIDWEGNFGGWGGAEYSDRLRVYNESYTNVCADMYLYTHAMGYVFMLRGGHALYHIFSDQPIRGYYQEGTPDIAYSSSTLFYDDNWSGNNTYDVYAPRPLELNEVNSSRIDGLRTKKQSLFDSRYQLASSAINTSNIGSQSVNYASSAGSVAWTNVSSRPTALSQFTNDLGNYGGWYSASGGTLSGSLSFADVADNIRFQKGSNHLNLKDPWSNFHLYIPSGGIYSDATAYYFRNTSSTIWLSIESGNVQASSSLRAPIFYDSADTGYYVDPNGNSVLTTATFTTNGSSTITLTSAGTNASMIKAGAGDELYLGGNDTWQMRFNGGNVLMDNGGYLQNNQSLRAPIFYDSADTFYYVDPNSTSRLYRVGSYYLSNIAAVSDDHPYGLYFDSGLSTAYAIYRESGAWSHPYSDLRIAFHTGIKIGANASYEGVRFYTDYDMSSQVMSVNNGSDPLGGGNVYVNNSLQAGSSLRAPIFYDSNDTAYYVDPNSTSNLAASYIGRVLINYDGTDTWFRMQSGNRMRITTTGGTDFIIPNTGEMTYNGNTVIHTGNIGSQSVNYASSAGDASTLGGYGRGNTTNKITYWDGSRNLYVNNPESYSGEVRLGAAWSRGGVYASSTLSMVTSSGAIDFVSNDVGIGAFRWDSTNGTRFIVGENVTTTPYTLIDSNKRPVIYQRGQYPVLTLDHTVTSNGVHGPTIQFVHNGYQGNQWVIGTNGPGTRLDIGFSNTAEFGNTSYNPHNGIGGYNGKTLVRMTSAGVAIGSLGTYPTVIEPAYTLDVRGNSYSSGNLKVDGFVNVNGATEHTVNDNGSVVHGTTTNNRVFINGSIQLTNNNDAIVIGRGTSTFLTDEEIGFGWGGGWYMTEGSYIRSRGSKSLHMNGGSVDYVGSMYLEGSGTYAHLQPNSGSYGSLQITNSKGSWSGIRFTASNVNIMANPSESGFHNNDNGWQILWSGGTLYVGKGGYGGSNATVWDSSNAPRANYDNLMYYQGFTLDANSMASNSTGFTYANNAPHVGPIVRFSTGGSYDLWLNSDYWGGNDLYFRTRNGDTASLNSWKRTLNATTDAYAAGMNQYVRTTDDVTHNSTTSPTFLVNNHSDNTKGYRIHTTSGASVSAMFTNSSNYLVIGAGAFGRINLNKDVHVNGVSLGVGSAAPSGTAGRIDASNDIVAYSSSDERLKHNITPIENAIDKVKSLTGVEFDWKPEYKHAHGYEGHDTGIIAQQVQEVIPSAVRTNDTGFLAVRYEKLIGLLIEGMKEQQAQIDELKAKLDGLTN